MATAPKQKKHSNKRAKDNEEESLKRKKSKKEQEFDTDWDIEKYRRDYESDDHWELRRSFMEAHKNEFTEERLVCLAQVFFNMELMGCKYPTDVMKQVAELSKDVAKQFREERSKKLKRTFVSASDAAEQRAKGRTTTGRIQLMGEQKQQLSNISTQKVTFTTPGLCTNNTTNIFDRLPFGNFVVYLHGGRNCLRDSAQRCKMDYVEKEEEVDGKREYQIYLNGKIISRASEDTVKANKMKAFKLAMEHLQQECYSIKPNLQQDTIKIGKSDNKVVCGVQKQLGISEETKLDANNKGYKIMKMMGWSGGGLGLHTQGREEPVGYLLKNNRLGFGKGPLLDCNDFKKILNNYINSNDIRELHFESTFTKEERALLHEIAGRFSLRSTSHGNKDNRSLVISKKFTNEQILTEILIHKNPNYLDKFFVQVPRCKYCLYPEHIVNLQLSLNDTS